VHRKILTLLLGLALCAPVAAAAKQGVTGSFDFAYANVGQLGVNGNDWSGGLAALYSYDNLNAQLSGQYDRVQPAAGGLNIWNIDGNFFWRDRKGLIGLSIGHGSVETPSGASDHFLTYGAFAEWYAAHDLSLRFKGGAFNRDNPGDMDGWYGAAAAEFYPLDNLGVTLSYGYMSDHATFAGIRDSYQWHTIGGAAEFLLMEEFPLSIGVGYEHSGYRNDNAFQIRLRYRFGVEGSLVEVDRQGPAAWSGTCNPAKSIRPKSLPPARKTLWRSSCSL
jgi:hypothetical protein